MSVNREQIIASAHNGDLFFVQVPENYSQEGEVETWHPLQLAEFQRRTFERMATGDNVYRPWVRENFFIFGETYGYDAREVHIVARAFVMSDPL